MLKALDESFIHELVEELHLLGSVCKDIADDILEHSLSVLHVVLQVRESHFGLDHPELRRVAGRVGLLRAERRAESIDVPERERKGLDVKLSADCQVRGLSEKVLGIVDLAVLSEGKLIEGKSRHLEHLAGAFRVTARDNGGVHVNKSSFHEERVNRISDQRAHAVRRRKGVGAGPQMRDRSEVLEAVALLLQRIIGRGSTFQFDLFNLHLEGLLRVRSQHYFTRCNDRSADVHLRDLSEVLQVLTVNQLKILEAGAVCKRDKADSLGIAVVADPAAYGHRLVCITVFFVK